MFWGPNQLRGRMSKTLIFIFLLSLFCPFLLAQDYSHVDVPRHCYDTIKSKMRGKKGAHIGLANHIVRQMCNRRFIKGASSDANYHPELYKFLKPKGKVALDAIAMLAGIVEECIPNRGINARITKLMKYEAYNTWQREKERHRQQAFLIDNDPDLSDSEKKRKKQRLKRELDDIEESTSGDYRQAIHDDRIGSAIFHHMRCTLLTLDKLGSRIYDEMRQKELDDIFGKDSDLSLPGLPAFPSLDGASSQPSDSAKPGKVVKKNSFCQIRLNNRGKKEVWIRIQKRQIIRPKGRRSTGGPDKTVRLERAQIEDLKRALNIRRKWRKGEISGFVRKLTGSAPAGGMFIVRAAADFLNAKDQMDLVLGSALVAPKAVGNPNARPPQGPKTPFGHMIIKKKPFEYRHRGYK